MTTKQKPDTNQELLQAQPMQALSPFEALEQLFENRFPRGWLRPLRGEWPLWSELAGPVSGTLPKVDVIDRDAEIVVKAELPGVDRKDVDISVTNNSVTIKASTRHQAEEEKGDYYRCEMSRGVFARTLMLPADVAEDKARARFKDGILELTLPKLEKARRHSVKVE